ncbi:iron chaperone [Enterococcus sp. DIV0800]|uniref:iron chaperone n=1 Tax=unclassified Enterococcus TaxID=2608891 RepID=UPI003D2FAC6F
METFEDYLISIENVVHRDKLGNLLQEIIDKFPELETRIGWSTPMFTHHGTFIIGFSAAKKFFSVSPEVYCLNKFLKDVEKSEYSHTDNIFRIDWEQPINFALLEKMISFNITDKKDYEKFWR